METSSVHFVRVPLIPAFFTRMEFDMRQNRKIKPHWL